MADKVREKLDKVLEGIKTHPDLHTRSFSLGARVYDAPALIDGKHYYLRVAFDVHPTTKMVTILDARMIEASGPH